MGRLLLLGWLAASVLIGLLIQININRINLIFIPLFLCMAFPLEWLWKHLKALFILSIITLLVAFSFFTYTYHGAEYRHQADGTFFTGLLPALDFARQEGNNPICVTDKVNMPYIFALFSEKMDPKLYLNNIRYESNSRQVISLGRYTFGENNCSSDPSITYILSNEKPPDNGIQYIVYNFDLFHVYTPEGMAK